MINQNLFADLINYLPLIPSTIPKGEIISINSGKVLGKIPDTAINDFCLIKLTNNQLKMAKVVGFIDDKINLTIFGNTSGIKAGDIIINPRKASKLTISKDILGKVINASGEIINFDLQNNSHKSITIDIEASPPPALNRKPIEKLFKTGINAIDGLLQIGVGQRIGLFAEAGTGKSTLLGMIAKNSNADVNVIALIGERGREVNEFLNDCLNKESLNKSVIVLSTSNESSLERKMAGYTATAIAEYYRNQGKKVLLMLDSLTRFSRAIREIGLANGELPMREGYTPSVYTELPQILERSGNNDKGSITAIYTILTNDQNFQDPLKDEIISILDGHIVLDKNLANSNIRPAIDITKSISRCQSKLISKEQLADVNIIKKIIYKLKTDKDLLQLGGAADKELEACLKLENKILNILNQGTNKGLDFEKLLQIFARISLEFTSST